MVSSQEGLERLIADAKVFNPERSKGITYIAKGFNQLYSYCVDFNSPVGYLIIFKTTSADLRLALNAQSHGTPFARLNNKTVFFIVVDIFPYEESASKRGRAQGYELTDQSLFELLEEEQSEVTEYVTFHIKWRRFFHFIWRRSIVKPSQSPDSLVRLPQPDT
jgi:hypothetical protein